ncbi:hypothetical protein ACWGQL_01255 [Streptomyces lydicus]
MERDDKRTDTEYKRVEDPSGRDGWLRLAANRTASADLQDTLAEVYDELITVEPPLAEEHRASAEKYRRYTTSTRDYTELALKRAGEL